MPATTDDALGVFTTQRPRLVRIAYRMLGSVAVAEDVVQGTWLPEPWVAAPDDELHEA